MAEFLRPNSNVTQSSFTNGFAAIDETSASDADFAYGANNTAAVLEVGLTDPTAGWVPGAGTINVRYRHAKVNNGALDGGGNAVTVTAAVYNGTTLIATDAAQTCTGTWTTRTWNPDLSSLTDWTDVRLRFTTSASGGGPSVRRGGAISWAEIETPDFVEYSPPTLAELTEDFEGTLVDGPKWSIWESATGSTVDFTGGELVMSLTQSDGDGHNAGLYGSTSASPEHRILDSDGIYVKLVQRLDTANTAAGGITWLDIYDNDVLGTSIGFEITTAGELNATVFNAGSLVQRQLISDTWDTDDTPWLKISLSGGTATWWTAPGGSTPGTWTSRHTNSSLPATFQTAKVYFGVQNDSWTATGALVSGAKFDGLNTAANANLDELSNDFSSGTIAFPWAEFIDGTASNTITGGRLEQSASSAYGYAHFYSDDSSPAYFKSFNSGRVFVRLVQPLQGVPSGIDGQAMFRLFDNQENDTTLTFFWDADTDTFDIFYSNAGVYNNVTTAAYSPSNHAWLSFRSDGANVYWDVAPSTASNPPQESDWNNLGSVAKTTSGFNFNAAAIALISGSSATGTAPTGPAIWDGLNTAANAPAAVTGSMAVTESGSDDFTADADLFVSASMAVTESGADDATADGVVTTPGNPLIETLQSSFAGATVDTNIWQTFTNGANGAITQDDELQVTPDGDYDPSTTPYLHSGAVTKGEYTLEGSSVYARISPVQRSLDGDFWKFDTFFGAVVHATAGDNQSPDDGVGFIISSHNNPRQFHCKAWNDLSDTWEAYNFTVTGGWDPVNHAWLRIREDSGTIYWEAAPDNGGSPGTWTTLTSQAHSGWTNMDVAGLLANSRVRFSATNWSGTNVTHSMITGPATMDGLNTAAGGAVDNNGYLAVTESGSDDFTGDADLFVSATVAVTESGADDATADGTVVFVDRSATMSVTESGSDDFTASGAVDFAGVSATMDVAESGADDATADGTVTFVDRSATMAVTEDGPDLFYGSAFQNTGTTLAIGVNIHTGGETTGENTTIADIVQQRYLHRKVRMDWFYDDGPWAHARDMVQKITARGGEVEVVLQTAYQWYDATTIDGMTAQAIYDEAYSQTFAAVDANYDIIKDWEILNEVQLRDEIQAAVGWNAQQEDTAAYEASTHCIKLASCLKGMADAIHQVATNRSVPLRVIMGFVGRDWGFATFLQDEGVIWDVTGWHIYPEDEHALLTVDTWYAEDLGLTALQRMALFGKPVTLNEFHSGEIYWPEYENTEGSTNTELGFQGLDKHLEALYSQTQCNLESVILYELLDDPTKDAPESDFGLMTNLTTPKVSMFIATAYSGGALSSAEKLEITTERTLLTNQQIADMSNTRTGNLAVTENASDGFAADGSISSTTSISTVVEDFDSALDPNKWSTWETVGGSVVFTDGEAVITPGSGNGEYTILYTDTNATPEYCVLDSTGVYVKLAQRLLTANSDADGETGFLVWDNDDQDTNVAFVVTTAGVLLARTSVAGVVTDETVISNTWDTDDTPWLKFTKSGGTVTWWTAPGGATPGTWTARHTFSPPINFGLAKLWFYTYAYWPTTGALVEPARIDGLNTNASVTVVGSMAVTESGSDDFTASASATVVGSMAVTESGSDDFTADADLFVSATMAVTESGSDDFTAEGVLAADTPLSSVIENFDSALDPQKWSTWEPTGSVVFTGGEAVITPGPGDNENTIFYSSSSGGYYQLDGNGVYVKLVQRLETANTVAGGETGFMVWDNDDQNTNVAFAVTTDGVLLARTVAAGVVTDEQVISNTWDTDGTPWLKMTKTGGTVTWWTAPGDHTPGTWTARHTNSSLPATFELAKLWFDAYSSNWATTGALVEPARFDGLNTVANVPLFSALQDNFDTLDTDEWATFLADGSSTVGVAGGELVLDHNGDNPATWPPAKTGVRSKIRKLQGSSVYAKLVPPITTADDDGMTETAAAIMYEATPAAYSGVGAQWSKANGGQLRFFTYNDFTQESYGAVPAAPVTIGTEQTFLRFRESAGVFYIDTAPVTGVAGGGSPTPVDAQAAIDAATAGSTVDLTNRTYSGSITINKALTLKGLSITSGSGQTAVHVTADNVTLDGLTLQGPQYAVWVSEECGIKAMGTPSNHITGLKIHNCLIRSYGDLGIENDYCDDIEIINNIVEDIVYGAMMLLSITGGLVQYNTVRRVGMDGSSADQSNNAYGIAISSQDPSIDIKSSDVIVDRNIVEDIPTWQGMDTHAGVRIYFTNNIVRRCWRGFFITSDGSNRTNEDCIVQYNRVEAPTTNDGYGIQLVNSDGGTFSDNNLIGWDDGTAVFQLDCVGVTISGNYENAAAAEPSPVGGSGPTEASGGTGPGTWTERAAVSVSSLPGGDSLVSQAQLWLVHWNHDAAFDDDYYIGHAKFDTVNTTEVIEDASGTMAASESGSDSLSSAGSIGRNATMAATEQGSDSAGVFAYVAVTGTLAAQEEGSDTASFDGDSSFTPRSAMMAATETAVDEVAADVNVFVVGALAVQEEGSDTAFFDGAASFVDVQASMGAIETIADSASASVAVRVRGSMAVTEPYGLDGFVAGGETTVAATMGAIETIADSSNFDGVVSVAGTLAVSEEGSDTFSAGASPSINATMGAIETIADSTDFDGAVRVAGTLAVEDVGNDAAAMSGSVPVIGAVAAAESTDKDDATAGGSVAVAAAMGAIETVADSSSGSGTVPVEAALAATEQGSDSILVNAGNTVIVSMGAIESGPDEVSGAGTVPVTGLMAGVEAHDTLSSAGVVVLGGSMGATETGADDATAAGRAPVVGAVGAAEQGKDQFSASTASGRVVTMAATESGGDGMAAVGELLVTGNMVTVELVGGDGFDGDGDVAVQGAVGATETTADRVNVIARLRVTATALLVEDYGLDGFAAAGVVADPPEAVMAAVESGNDTMLVYGLVTWEKPDPTVGNVVIVPAEGPDTVVVAPELENRARIVADPNSI